MLQVGDGKGLLIAHTGDTDLFTSTRKLKMSNILHVPSLQKSLLFVSQFTSEENNVYFEFHPNYFCVKDRQMGKRYFPAGE